jgi:hypothetical protein
MQDEAGWRASFGLDVIAGMLQLPEEDRHGRPKQQSFDQQRKAMLEFLAKVGPARLYKDARLLLVAQWYTNENGVELAILCAQAIFFH